MGTDYKATLWCIQKELETELEKRLKYQARQNDDWYNKTYLKKTENIEQATILLERATKHLSDAEL